MKRHKGASPHTIGYSEISVNITIFADLSGDINGKINASNYYIVIAII